MDAVRHTYFNPRRLPMPEQSTNVSDANLSHKIRRYSLILLVIAVTLAIWGEVSRVMAHSALAKETADAAVLTVSTVTPSRSALGEELVLPGTVQAYICLLYTSPSPRDRQK